MHEGCVFGGNGWGFLIFPLKEPAFERRGVTRERKEETDSLRVW
jgi:hypothetical protein